MIFKRMTSGITNIIANSTKYDLQLYKDYRKRIG